jgi:ribonuclease HI
MDPGDKARLLERLAREAARTDEERSVLREAAALLRAREAPAEKPPAAATDCADAVLWSDGAARGNPGPAGIGALLQSRAGKCLAEVSAYIGDATNNVAEYRALLAGLERALELGVRRLEVRADSELMIRQLEGRYRVKTPHLRPLFERAKEMLARLDDYRLQHVPRHLNAEADRLANLGIDTR